MTDTIRTIIIDDEEDGREALRLAIEQFCPQVQLVALCGSPQEGLSKIQELDPDLVFLDVQMPKMSGFDLLEKLGQINFEVIFVTAFDKYAIKAIRFSALDYLLKPVDIDELVSAVERVNQRSTSAIHYQSLFTNVKSPHEELTRLAIPSENEIFFENLQDIIYCQADGSYTVLHLVADKKITVSKTLKEFENILPDQKFCRIHHSTLVNMDHVVKYIRGEGGYVMVTGNQHLDVSRRKKESFMQLLNKI